MPPSQHNTDSEATASPERAADKQGELRVPHTEFGASQALESGKSGPAPAPAAPPPAQMPQQGPQREPVSQPQQLQPAAVMRGNPQVADDADLIEKEWVIRAKQIVEHTRTDPHRQSEAMNLVKADYLRKRYNRIIKLAED